jgi:hypothetical protein
LGHGDLGQRRLLDMMMVKEGGPMSPHDAFAFAARAVACRHRR